MERQALFISHAAPEDNDFTLWLGAKLSALGYEVWADVLSLAGGNDWQTRLENALRHRACKVLLVANANSVSKQGVRNEIQIASDVGKQIKDGSFIIPLRLSAYEKPFLIAHAQYINFEPSWASGLAELLHTLENEYAVPKAGSTAAASWQNLQMLHGRSLVSKPESLISNWIKVSNLPQRLFHYGNDLSADERKRLKVFPEVEHGNGFLSCERTLGRGNSSSIAIEEFLEKGWPALCIEQYQARKIFVSLVRQSMNSLFEQKGLNNYLMSNGVAAWWVPGTAPKTKVRFDWGEFKGLRQIQGVSAKRKVHWHFGVSSDFRTFPVRYVRLKARLIFTEESGDPIASPTRMHALRRSFAKGWRNARWRDMLLAFLYWIADGKQSLAIPINASEELELILPPMTFSCPIGVLSEEVEAADEDDPDIDEGFDREEETHD